MQGSATAASGGWATVDRWIDSALSIGADPEPSDRRPTVRFFERILLLHLAFRLWDWAFAPSVISPTMQIVLAATMSGCFAMLFVRRLAPLAIGAAFCVMLYAAWGTFPMTSNHAFLELWALLLLIVVGGQHEDEASVWLAAMRWSIAAMLFYTGLQKVLYGAYFSGQFLLVEMILKPDFGEVLSWMLPTAEWERLRGLIPNAIGAGPYKTDAPLLLLASNAVYLFELAVPFGLMWKRTRPYAVFLLFPFTIAIQAGAREMFFALLLANVVLLFWRRDLHRRAFPFFVAGYVAIVAARALGFGGFM